MRRKRRNRSPFCKKCDKKYFINIRRHRLKLCREHFVHWFQDKTDRTVQKYKMFDHTHKILIAVSGGKDSLCLWDALLRRGYEVDGLFIDLGIGENFSANSLSVIRKFLEQEHPEAKLHVVDLKNEYGESIPQLIERENRGRIKACALCGLVKRYIMNDFALKNGYHALATGHTLDDEAGILLRNTLHWETGYLSRQGPVLEQSEGFSRKVKPLVRFMEKEIKAYAMVRMIQPVTGECPFSTGSTTNRYKELILTHESSAAGACLQFYEEFVKAKKRGDLLFPEQDTSGLTPCVSCGLPTKVFGECAFCRIWSRQKMSAPGPDGHV